MVYPRIGSSDLFLIVGCMTSNFLYLSFFNLHSSLLWRADTTIFSKLNKSPPPFSNNPSSNMFEINKPPPPPPEGLIVQLQYWEAFQDCNGKLHTINCHCLTKKFILHSTRKDRITTQNIQKAVRSRFSSFFDVVIVYIDQFFTVEFNS